MKKGAEDLLQLKNIKKDYLSGEETVHALKGVDLAFRESEFVSILGQSGCGKTTLLNIIGGLDRYTSGDLIINGTSTKEYKDRDWDTYRNHSIGFVFQSYNLIPHQNVLSNVELALTLSGVSKTERRKRAKEALEKVGLGDQLKKMPNQMSGGQMQRVAIARALVNDPDILLADEPTGALDSETSLQVMEILKEVARDKLVIMVTHNPELAEKYSTRIIRLLDGEIISDTMPYTPEAENRSDGRLGKKPSMSFATAFSLSLRNLMTKKGRTILTAFAGSIGIIGIALILSLSSGMQNHIDRMEEDTLTSYPITIEQASMDTASMMTSMMSMKDQEYTEGGIHSRNIMTGMISSFMSEITTNDLSGFKKYLEEEENDIAPLASQIQYKYRTEVGMYAMLEDGSVRQVNPCNIMEELGLGGMGQMMNNNMFMSTDVTRELVDNERIRESDFELVTGAWPAAYNEVVLTVTNDDAVSDYTLYALGLLDMEQLTDAMLEIQQDIMENGAVTKDINIDTSVLEYSYEDLMNMDIRLTLPTDYYALQEDGTYLDMRHDEEYMKQVAENAEPLKIVGIVRSTSKNSNEYGTLAYTSDLVSYVIEKTNEAAVLIAQKADPETDVFTGLPFPGTPAAIAIEEEAAREAAESDAEAADAAYSEAQLAMLDDAMEMVPEQFRAQIAQLPVDEQVATFVENGLLTQEEFDALADTDAGGTPMAAPREKKISDSTYEDNLNILYATSTDTPSAINLYAASFDDKEALTDALDAYNQAQSDAGNDEKVIRYTDYVGLLMSSVTNIVNIVSYVLIAFVGISLVVSSIMIGVITLISVQERTKEIGILRSIGASKKDVSRVFNAETLIIGLAAGVIGIGVTLLLNIPINLIINHLANIDNVSQLPPVGGAILVIISVILTMVAGLIPAKTAAKKDPVEALRTE